MAAARKQLNFRTDDETIDRLNRLVDAISASLNVKVSQADVVRLALIEMEKDYPPEAEKPRPKSKK